MSHINELAKKYLSKFHVPQLSAAERKASTFLVVDPDPNARYATRQTLSSLGYGSISDASDHYIALEKLRERPVTHIIFDAKKTNMPVKEFLEKALQIDNRIVALPSSFEPSVDDVFSLLILGARGYIVKPVNPQGLDDAIVNATKGDPLPDVILYAKNRNQALAAIIMSSFDKVALILRQATQFETARREIPRAQMNLGRAIDMARLFIDGGEEALVNEIMEYCIERSNGPASKLGRLRKRLSMKKLEDACESSQN